MTDSPGAAKGVSSELADRLALALDVDDLVEASRLAKELKPWFGVVKVGLELYSAVGPDAIGTMRNLGYDVFLDLKLHDIPTTVEKASRVVGSLGARYLTLHAQGGVPMLKAGCGGLAEGAAKAGLPEPIALAVTVLTSDADAPEHIVPKRVRVAAEAGCGGLVCAADDLKDAREFAPRLKRVVPGIRPDGAPVDDQRRAATPKAALDAGADLLVIGRPITRAEEPAAAAASLASSLS